MPWRDRCNRTAVLTVADVSPVVSISVGTFEDVREFEGEREPLLFGQSTS